MTIERAQRDPAVERDRRLRRERELDAAPLREVVPGDGEVGYPLEPPAEDDPRAARRRRRRGRRVLAAVIAAALFAAGLGVGKLSSPDKRTQEASRPAGRAVALGPGTLGGTLVGVDAGTLELRRRNGTPAVLATTATTLVTRRGRPASVGDLRPGERVVVATARDAHGRLVAGSIAVIPPRGAGPR